MSLIPFKDDPSDENTLEWVARQFRKITDFSKEATTQLLAHLGLTNWNAHGNTAVGTQTSPLKIEPGAFWIEGSVGDTPASFAVDGAGPRFMWIPGKGAFRAGIPVTTDWDAANIGTNSVAIGNQTNAKFTNDLALGSAAKCNGSVFGSGNAIGANCQATGGFNASVGIGCITGTFFCAAIGNACQATTNAGATALGNTAIATGSNSGAIGLFVNATATNACTVGIGVSSGSPLVNAQANTMYLGVNSTEPTIILQNQRCSIVGGTKFDPLHTLDVGGSVGYQYRRLTSVDSPFTAGLTDELLFFVDTTGINPFVFNLPLIDATTDRRMYHIKNANGGAGINDVQINTNSGQFIDQSTPFGAGTVPSSATIKLLKGQSVQIVAALNGYLGLPTWWII